MSKGAWRRPEAAKGAFASNWDRIFRSEFLRKCGEKMDAEEAFALGEIRSPVDVDPSDAMVVAEWGEPEPEAKDVRTGDNERG